MIIQNAVYVPKLDRYFKSVHVHDYIEFEVNGTIMSIDGGNEYLKRSGHDNELIEFSLGDSSTLLDILNKLLWGHRGKDGKQPMIFSPIKYLELEHLIELSKYLKKMKDETYSFSNFYLYRFVVCYWINQKSK